MERKIEKKENFFSVELREGEQITISVTDGGDKPDEIVFIVPEEMTMNCYMKRKSALIQYK